MEDYFRVGVLLGTHGLRGEIKLFPTTDDIERFKILKKAFVINSNSERLYLEVEGVKFFKNLVILKFKGIDTIDEVAKYKKLDLFVTREEAVPLSEGEYYVSDVLGLIVKDEENKEYGRVKDVLDTGANKVIVVTPNEGVHHKEIYLPYIKDCVREIRLEEGVVIVHIMKGLLEL